MGREIAAMGAGIGRSLGGDGRSFARWPMDILCSVPRRHALEKPRRRQRTPATDLRSAHRSRSLLVCRMANISSLRVMAGVPKPEVIRSQSDGGVPEPLTNAEHSELTPSWSPDGQSVVFSYAPFRRKNPGNVGAFILNLTTHEKRKIPGSEGYFVRLVSGWPLYCCQCD